MRKFDSYTQFGPNTSRFTITAKLIKTSPSLYEKKKKQSLKGTISDDVRGRLDRSQTAIGSQFRAC